MQNCRSILLSSPAYFKINNDSKIAWIESVEKNLVIDFIDIQNSFVSKQVVF